MKKTAVQWFRERLFFKGSYNGQELKQLFDETLEMVKKQIIKVFVDVSKETWKGLGRQLTLQDIIDFQKIAEIYYNEEFKSE